MIQVELILEIDQVRATEETEAQVLSEISAAIERLVPPEVIQMGGVRILKLVVQQGPSSLVEQANDAIGVPRPPTVEEEPK